MSPKRRSLWLEQREPSTFADALTADLPPTEHSCRPFLPMLEEAFSGRTHPLAECPGPITLADVAQAAFGEGER